VGERGDGSAARGVARLRTKCYGAAGPPLATADYGAALRLRSGRARMRAQAGQGRSDLLETLSTFLRG